MIMGINIPTEFYPVRHLMRLARQVLEGCSILAQFQRKHWSGYSNAARSLRFASLAGSILLWVEREFQRRGADVSYEIKRYYSCPGRSYISALQFSPVFLHPSFRDTLAREQNLHDTVRRIFLASLHKKYLQGCLKFASTLVA